MKWFLLVLVVFSFLVAPAAAGPFVDRYTVYVQPVQPVQPVGPGFVVVSPPPAYMYQPLYFDTRPPGNPTEWFWVPRPRRTVIRYVYP